MSWIVTRRKGRDFQQYVDEDIYGNGHWVSNEDAKLTDLPVLYTYRDHAMARMRTEKEMDPEWQYEVEYYE